jgi:hypothetical protein
MASKRELQIERVCSLVELGARQAGDELENIANSEGDSGALALINELPVATVTEILTAYDYTTYSIIPYLITPEKVKDIVKNAPAFWNANSFVSSDYDDIQRSAQDLLTHLVLVQQDTQRQITIIKSIAEIEEGLNLFIIALIGVESISNDEAFNYLDNLFDNVSLSEQGSVSELLEIMRKHTPDVLTIIKTYSQSDKWQQLVLSLGDFMRKKALKERHGINDDFDDMFTKIQDW